MDFIEFKLNEKLQKGIMKAGYSTCTPVQEQVLKTALEGADLYVQSQTGTGKTAAFLVAIIQEMLTRQDAFGKKALVMVPTRELAVQVEQEARVLLSGTDFRAASFYGGVGYSRQNELLEKGVEIIVGTPGRVIDLQESGSMDLSKVGFLVIDEADRMFDMGFYPDLRKLIKVLPNSASRQTMLFSATLNTYVKNLAWEYTVEAKEITIESENITVDEIDQQLVHVSSDSKMKLLLGILNSSDSESAIIFCNTKRTCEVVAKRLQLNGIKSEFIIGDLPQFKRLQVLDSFKKGSLKCLVATDVAARGIDISDLSMVVNYDLPNEAENYVHRIGRTARAGRSGKAYTFCSEQDVYNLPAIERYLGGSIPSVVAFEDMFAQDKSANIYIKTGSYLEDESFDGTGRNRAGGRHSLKESGNSRPKEKYKANSKGCSKKKYDGKKHTQISKTSAKDYGVKKANAKTERYSTMELSSMSFEERMKVYKEKYGGEQQQNTAKKTISSSSPSKPAEKKGLLSFVKKIFSKKDDKGKSK